MSRKTASPFQDAMSHLPAKLRGTGKPIYLAVADAISEAVLEGKLAPGDRVPTHRALAEVLGVDLTTVTRAYAEARSRGLIEATVGRGTFIRDPALKVTSVGSGVTPVRDPGGLDLAMNLPPPVSPPIHEIMRRGLGELLSQPPADLLSYRTGSGSRKEREAGAAWLRPTLGEISPDRILITAGAQPAMMAMVSSLVGSGDALLADRFTYPGMRAIAAQLGVMLVPVAADRHGMLPEAIEAACKSHDRVKGLYCIPTMHNPTAVTMPLERRQAVAEAARRNDLFVIEDDAYGLLPSVPVPAIASFAPDITFHVSTLSKVVSPSLRVAFLVVPNQRTAERLQSAVRANVLMPSPLLTTLAATWVRNGTAGAILDTIRRECAARQAIARKTLPEGSFESETEGLHLWIRLPPGWDGVGFAAHLRNTRGLAVVPSEAFAVGGQGTGGDQAAVRLSLGAIQMREDLSRALEDVAGALREDRSQLFSAVV